MASPFVEKLQVAAVTATLVSAGWIVAGAFVLDRAETAEIEQEIAAKQTPTSASSPTSAPSDRVAAEETDGLSRRPRRIAKRRT